MTRIFSISIVTTLLLLSSNLLAHSEHDKARFVAPDGHDIGKCDVALRPCKTIGYAVTQANKGDKVLVASGSYSITDVNELFYLQSKIVPVKGGYNKFDHYQTQSPANNVSTLIGVPHEFASELEKNGFHVITDRKAIKSTEQLKAKLSSYANINKAQSNEVCSNGSAADFSCNNIDLLSHLPLEDLSTSSSAASDIWGHVDLNTGKEYAIMGLEKGTSVIDVSDPTNPVEIGAIEGRSVVWRDIKVYQYFDKALNLWQAYAYITLDVSSASFSDYVTILDLNNLPHSVNVVEKNETAYRAHNVYISNVDYSLNIAHPGTTPVLHLVGTEKQTGQFINLNLTDPKTLSQIPTNYQSSLSPGSRPYTHDGASMTITDSRKDTGCVNGQAFCTVFFDFNESEILLWDITDKENVVGLGRGSYLGAQYVHSGWSSEDNQYVFVHDELDETNLGINTTLRVFDITDLQNPTIAGAWTGDSKAIDHNGFVRGNRYYMSNYEKGLTVLDITDPTSPEQVGYFDTFTLSNNASFNGAWGVYPFLPSGNILVSDIGGGLFVLKDRTRSVAQGTLSFESAQTYTEDNKNLTINVERLNADAENEAISVEYVVLPGSADLNDDFSVANGTLTWNANDVTAKNISIDIAENTDIDEVTESFFIRLYNPSNGASLGNNSYSTVKIVGADDSGTGTFALAETHVAETQETLTIAINRIGSDIGDLAFNYALVGNEATVGVDLLDAAGQVSWNSGENATQYIDISIIDDDDEEQDETFTITLEPIGNAKLGTNPSITVTIADDETNLAPTVSISENFEVNTGQTTELVAIAEDSNGDEMTYLWEQTSGTTVDLTNADQLEARFVAPNNAGTLIFSFTATDFKGAAASANVTVTVVAPTVAPPVTSNSSSGGGGAMLWLIALLLPLYRIRNIT